MDPFGKSGGRNLPRFRQITFCVNPAHWSLEADLPCVHHLRPLGSRGCSSRRSHGYAVVSPGDPVAAGPGGEAAQVERLASPRTGPTGPELPEGVSTCRSAVVGRSLPRLAGVTHCCWGGGCELAAASSNWRTCSLMVRPEAAACWRRVLMVLRRRRSGSGVRGSWCGRKRPLWSLDFKPALHRLTIV